MPTFWQLIVHGCGLAAAITLSAAGGGSIDSGGGRSIAGNRTIHSSLGGAFSGDMTTTSRYGIFIGFAEVFYPPLPPVDPDSDGNGLPDDWELTYFGMIGIDPDADADGDGTSNAMEFLALTHPLDSMSVFRPFIIRNGGWLDLYIETAGGRRYRVLGSPDLQDWTELDAFDGNGRTALFSYDTSVPGSMPVFFRVEILFP